MPQMSPLLWFNLYMYFLLMLYFMIVLISNYKIYNPMNKELKISKINFKWLW
nr:ATP synthase F0 subunit 8 [Sycophaga agraensis]